MSKFKILHVLVSSTYNGAENVVCQIANLFKGDPDFEIVYCSPDGPIREALKEQEVRFAPLKTLSVKELRNVIDTEKPAIIHAHDMRANFYVYLSNKNVPVVAHVHNNNYDSRGLSIKSLLFLLAALKTKHIFWVSKTSFDGYYFNKRLQDKSQILYNVINIDNLKAKANQDKNSYDYDFVYLGRLTYQKNPERLVSVMEKVVEKDNKVKFAILGEGELFDSIKHYIESHSLSNNIHLLGYSSNPYKILQCSKAMIMTSRWEGLPMCALEAFALGIPVITTPADGLIELIEHNIDGFISDDDDSLVEEILKIHHKPSHQEALSQGALSKINNIMNLGNYKKSIKDIYSSIVSQN